MRPPCIGAILDTVKSWIGTGTASPASSSKVPSRSAVSSGGDAQVSPAPCASFATSRRRAQRTLVGSGPVGPCMRRVMFAHIVQVEVVWLV